MDAPSLSHPSFQHCPWLAGERWQARREREHWPSKRLVHYRASRRSGVGGLAWDGAFLDGPGSSCGAAAWRASAGVRGRGGGRPPLGLADVLNDLDVLTGSPAYSAFG